jgi:hypothetical protein
MQKTLMCYATSIIGGDLMKKRQFLAPLAVSVAALLGGAMVPVQASTVPVATFSESSASKAMNLLVLTRSTGKELRLADHESHASHESHSSHSSGN